MSYDTDAQAYITAVEAADDASLPTYIKNAIDAFVVGAKADGFWTAIKAACFLAGPATLAGALVPLVGTAPTNVGGLFVDDDHSQAAGLIGNGSTKYLNSNRNNNADPQNNFHLALYTTTSPNGVMSGAAGGSTGASSISATASRSRSSSFTNYSVSATIGMLGISRIAAGQYTARRSGDDQAVNVTSQVPADDSLAIFANNNGGVAAAVSSTRLSWYSIGESLNLANLDTRLAAYMAALTAPPIQTRRRRDQRNQYGGGL